jgi:flagellar M-ring protein FliF
MKLREYLSKFSKDPLQHLNTPVVIISVVMVLSLAVFLFYLLLADSYSTLFTDLEPPDAANIVAELDKNKVEYKLEKEGTSIKVRSDKVYETRLKVMKNLPSLNGGVGFEIFDKDNFGTTEFAQRINYQRALQGELARTIMAMEEIKHARVHLVLNSTSIFKKKEADNSASVTLIMKKNMRLSPQQIAGIQRLIAASAPGILVEKVAILDQKGVLLSEADSDNMSIGTANKKLQVKQEIESYLSQKAQFVLDRTFGPGIAFVSVDAVIDFDNIKRSREQVISPKRDDDNVIKKKESFTSDAKKTGADNNSRSSVEIDYQVSKELEQIASAPGSVKHLSVAVIVPEGVAELDKQKLHQLVGSAVGIIAARGDEIAITNSLRDAISRLAEKQKSAAGAAIDVQGKPKTVDTTGQMPDTTRATGLSQMYGYVQSNPATALTVVVFMLLLLITSVAWLTSRLVRTTTSQSRSRTISDDEKRQMLSDLKDWLRRTE